MFDSFSICLLVATKTTIENGKLRVVNKKQRVVNRKNLKKKRTLLEILQV